MRPRPEKLDEVPFEKPDGVKNRNMSYNQFY